MIAGLPPVAREWPPVAIVAHAHPSISRGGAEIAAHALFLGLRALGVPAVFIAAVPIGERHRLDLRPDEQAVFYDPTQYDYLYQIGQASVAAQLQAVLARTGARLVNFHHFMYFGANALRDVAEDPRYRVVLTLHEFLAICHNHGQLVTRPHLSLCAGASDRACGACFPELGWRRMHLRRAAMRESLGAVARFISPSRFLADHFTAWGLPPGSIDIIENGLVTTAPEQPPARPAAGQKSWVFGYFGQITPFKGVDTIIAAAGLLAKRPEGASPIEIRIHGNISGPQEEFRRRLADATAALPLLKLAGPYDNSRVLDLMAACDYVVTPSLWWENSPVVIQEAFAAGCPVVCTGIGGMAEKVPDGVAGLHFRRGDAADLARVIGLAADPQLHARLRQGLPQPIGIQAMAEQYVASFSTVLAQFGPGNTKPAKSGSVVGSKKPRRSIRKKRPQLMES